MTNFLFDGSDSAGTTIMLAHGAGGPMDSAAMNAVAKALASRDFRVARFEFGYMASRRRGARRPCPRGETLRPEYLAAVQALACSGRLVIGGKSLGGRVASMVADQLLETGKIAGLLCLGYPFHPIGKPDQLRTAHLASLRTPTLIVQGTNDPFGTRDEVLTYKLASTIEICWLEQADHDLKPRKSTTGWSARDYLAATADRVATWSVELPG